MNNNFVPNLLVHMVSVRYFQSIKKTYMKTSDAMYNNYLC